eukprot:Amastigsp_a841847_15.p6 type:complete len:119 gc:universal Amastigsp_a841847_15:699-1055(+)
MLSELVTKKYSQKRGSSRPTAALRYKSRCSSASVRSYANMDRNFGTGCSAKQPKIEVSQSSSPFTGETKTLQSFTSLRISSRSGSCASACERETLRRCAASWRCAGGNESSRYTRIGT